MKDFDEILESGDEAAIEAALAEMETTGDVLFDDGSVEEEAPVVAQKEEAPQEAAPAQEVAATATSENDVENTDSSPAQEQEAATEEKELPIETKAGNSTIPYSVLTAAREVGNTAKAALEAANSENEALKKQIADAQNMSDVYSKQLEKAGIELGLTPEQMLNDPKVMDQLKEDYPGIGEAVAALAAQLQPQQTTPAEQPAAQAQESAPTPVEEAFEQTAHLKGWMNTDVDRWQLAQQIDQRLANDPSFANKTISERFTEVEKRVMSAFGEVVPATATTEQPAAPAPQQKAPIPNTPTDIGHQGNDTNPHAGLLDQDAGAMASQMEGMTEAQIEALLEDASDFL